MRTAAFPADEWYEPIVILRPERVRFGLHCRVDSFVKIEGGLGVDIGDSVHIASFAHVGIGGGQLIVGDEAMIASGARILTGSNTEEGIAMSSSAPRDRQHVIRATTIIGERAFIGAGATILPGCRIGNGAVVGAGAVVPWNTHVPPDEVWVGVPAYKLRDRRRP